MGVQVACHFDLPLPASEVWQALKDVEHVAACFPGVSAVRALDAQSCAGTVTVKLGPMQLEFEGQFAYVGLDDDAMAAEARAHGQDRRGRGSAQSTIRLQVQSTPTGCRTLVTADTELVGTVAQFGRAKSLIQSVAETLIGDFAQRLGAALASDAAAAGRAGADEAAVPPPRQPVSVSGFGVLVRALTHWWRGLFGRA